MTTRNIDVKNIDIVIGSSGKAETQRKTYNNYCHQPCHATNDFFHAKTPQSQDFGCSLNYQELSKKCHRKKTPEAGG